MKIYKILAFFVVISLIFISCEKEMITFNAADSFVAFEKSSGAIGEQSSSDININVMVASLKGSDVSVDFEFTTEGQDNPAIEGVDFEVINTTNAVTIESGVGTAAITIRPIDNDIRDLDKTIKIILSSNSAGYQIGMAEGKGMEYVLTIGDDEHPLANWIGTYAVAAASYGKPGVWDEAWTVTTAPDPDDVNNLILTGVGSPTGTAIYATIDLNAMTIAIKAGQVLKGDVYTYGDINVVYATSGFTYDSSKDIVGTIGTDGSILVDNWGHLMTGGYAGDLWDVFNTTWTKQ